MITDWPVTKKNPNSHTHHPYWVYRIRVDIYPRFPFQGKEKKKECLQGLVFMLVMESELVSEKVCLSKLALVQGSLCNFSFIFQLYKETLDFTYSLPLLELLSKHSCHKSPLQTFLPFHPHDYSPLRLWWETQLMRKKSSGTAASVLLLQCDRKNKKKQHSKYCWRKQGLMAFCNTSSSLSRTPNLILNYAPIQAAFFM